jgi:hypothetical protein
MTTGLPRLREEAIGPDRGCQGSKLSRLSRGGTIIIDHCENDDPKIALFALHTLASARLAGAGGMDEGGLTVDGLSPKPPWRCAAAGMFGITTVRGIFAADFAAGAANGNS